MAGLLYFQLPQSSLPGCFQSWGASRNGTWCPAFPIQPLVASQEPVRAEGPSHAARQLVRPEQMPSHQRDFPRREEPELPSGSGGLGLMVVCYLIAMFAGVLLLGYLTAPKLPDTAAVVQLRR